ncbi:unnamed protein product [Peniophora sp. CBMAI 1063]|nr:unnamed protein product [Peniophora sp. CBMAI 1063]
MAQNTTGNANPAQLAALLAAAGGRVAPAGNALGAPAQGAAPEQANPLALLTLQNQQAYAQPASWAGLAQLFQPQPAPPPPPPQPAQQPAQISQEDKEAPYRGARSDNLDKTLVLFLRAAQSSNMTRYAILEDMNGRHGHSSEWWKTYYLIFADDIDRLVKLAGTSDDGTAGCSTPARRKPLGSAGTLRPVTFPFVAESPSTSRKRKARTPSGSSSDGSETERTAHASCSRPAPKVARRTETQGTSDVDDELGDITADIAVGNPYKLTIPTTLPKRAPSIPTNLAAGAKGNYKYTDEELAYFVDTILWQAKTVPNVSRATVVATLSARAPHHSEESWKSFWKRAKGPDILREGLRMAAEASATTAAPKEEE